MEKKRSSIALIFLLIALLCFCWLLSISRLQQRGMPVQNSDYIDAAYVPQDPITISHTFQDDTSSYSGSLSLSVCQNLETGVSASGTDPAHVHLLFTVTRSGSCNSHVMVAAPFAVSVSAQKSSGAVLDGVTINNTAAAFSVVDAQ